MKNGGKYVFSYPTIMVYILQYGEDSQLLDLIGVSAYFLNPITPIVSKLNGSHTFIPMF